MMARVRGRRKTGVSLPPLIESAVKQLLDEMGDVKFPSVFLAWSDIQKQQEALPAEMPNGKLRFRWGTLAKNLKIAGGWADVKVVRPKPPEEHVKCKTIPGFLFYKSTEEETTSTRRR